MQSRGGGGGGGGRGVGSGLKKEKRERERERERIGYIFSLFRLPMAPVSDTARHGHSWSTRGHGCEVYHQLGISKAAKAFSSELK